MTKKLLEELNMYRDREGKVAITVWKKLRLPELEAYRADAIKRMAKADKTTTNKQAVADMLIGGTTIADIASKFAISPVAARSLIGDVKRMGIQVARDGDTYRRA